MPLIAGALSTLLLCFIGYVIAHRVARRLQASRATKIGSVYSAAMFNTGLAQVLVVLFFPNYQWILFPAFVLTFFQHFGAALFYSKLEHQDFQVRRI
jgi:predicted Na+-dependent transporter